MGDQAGTRPRPLARSLDPLGGESIGGYLLRLAHRLCLSPVKLARWVGCDCAPLSRRLLFDLDTAAFAAAARLSPDEAATLTLAPWADRYPPIARALTRRSTKVDSWLFNRMPRYCPQCLAGDGSPVQEQHGGPWKKDWHLPISFACPEHQVFLRSGCPREHPPPPSSRLITSIGDSTLHPAQCRYPRRTGWPGPTSSCHAWLDQADATVASHALLTIQQRLLAALDPHHPAEDAEQLFTDLRVITALLCASWPAGQELLEPALAGPVAGHISQLRSRASGNLSLPPQDPVAAGALLAAAAKVRDSDDLPAALSRYHEAARAGRPSKSPWAHIVDRHASSCSPALQDAAEPLIRGYRRQSGPHSPKAPARSGSGYRPENIPAFLEDAWFERHLAQLGCKNRLSRVLRRTAAATLVQWSAGGSLGDAAAYLGINPKGRQFAPTGDLYQWLDSAQVRPRFTTALDGLAADLSAAPGLLDYQHRRDALRTWSLPPGTWTEIISQLPPVPGPVQPTVDERKRQEASAFIWAHVTQGELRFAPRTIEARQPEPIRRAWAARHGATWHQLTRPDPLNHYAHLRALLTAHARQLALEIDETS